MSNHSHALWEQLANHFGVDVDEPVDPYNDAVDHFELLYRSSIDALAPGETRVINASHPVTTVNQRTGVSRRFQNAEWVSGVTAENFDESVDEAFALLDENGRDSTWYAAIGLQHRRPDEHWASARRDDSAPARVLFLDLDIAGDGHKSKSLPTASEAIEIVQEFERYLGRCPAITFTGGGMQCYWILADDADAALTAAWREVPGAYRDDTSIVIDALSPEGQQLCRIAGSVNTKYSTADQAVRVRWLRYEIAAKPPTAETMTIRVHALLTSLGWEPTPEPVTQPARAPYVPQLTSTDSNTSAGSDSPLGRLNAAVTPLEVMRMLFPIAQSATPGRWEFTPGGVHIEVASTGAVRLFGLEHIRTMQWGTNHAIEVKPGVWYKSASSLLTAIYGDAKVIAGAVLSVESNGGTISDVLSRISQNRDAGSLRGSRG